MDLRVFLVPDMFFCALSRNVSACGEAARKSLRETRDLVDALVTYLNISVQKRSEYDTKAVENVVCVLRNLSYKCQEVEDPDYDKNSPGSARDPRSKSAPSGSPKQKPKKGQIPMLYLTNETTGTTLDHLLPFNF